MPKLSDFGLAKMLEMEETKVFTDVRGTIGYMDPEYITHSKLTCSSDIYSFGVVALQLLSGRKVIELDIVARDSLTKKVTSVIRGKWYSKIIFNIKMKSLFYLRFVSFHFFIMIVIFLFVGRPRMLLVGKNHWKNS